MGDRALEVRAIESLARIGRSAPDAASARTLLVVASRLLDDVTSGADRPTLLFALALLHRQVGNEAESGYYSRLTRRRLSNLPLGQQRAARLFDLAHDGMLPKKEAIECLEEAHSMLNDADLSGSRLALAIDKERVRLARLDESEGEGPDP